MTPEEPVQAALRRPDLPWPQEPSAYDRFLRRRARRSRTVRVAVAAAAAALLGLTTITARLLPNDREAAAPPTTASMPATTPPTAGIHRNEPSGSEFRQLDAEQLVARGKRGAFAWSLSTDRVYQLDSEGKPDGGP